MILLFDVFNDGSTGIRNCTGINHKYMNFDDRKEFIPESFQHVSVEFIYVGY